MREFEYESFPRPDGLPTVVLSDVERAIGEISYHRVVMDSGAETTTTLCTIVMDNGHTVTATSACVIPEKFDEEIGQNLARAAAVAKIWELLGYELRLKLNAQ